MSVTSVDGIVTLSNDIDLDGTLQEDVRKRVDQAIALYERRVSPFLIMSGCHSPRDLDVPTTHAEAMKQYAVSQSVPPGVILEEALSLDTVGQAYFLKRDVFLPLDWNCIAVVSSDYHMPRVQQIFDFVLGEQFDIRYVGAKTSLSQDRETTEAEKARLGVFLTFFQGFSRGDDQAIGERLFTAHPFYKGKDL